MKHPTGQVLDYAAPSHRASRQPWAAIGAAALLAAGGVLLGLCASIEEPFYGPARWQDVVAFRVLPPALLTGWAAWVAAVIRLTRPRVRGLWLAAAVLPFAVFSCRMALWAHRNFESDRAQEAEWHRMAAEDAAARWRD